MKCIIILIGFPRFDEGTEPAKLGLPNFVLLVYVITSLVLICMPPIYWGLIEPAFSPGMGRKHLLDIGWKGYRYCSSYSRYS